MTDLSALTNAIIEARRSEDDLRARLRFGEFRIGVPPGTDLVTLEMPDGATVFHQFCYRVEDIVKLRDLLNSFLARQASLPVSPEPEA